MKKILTTLFLFISLFVSATTYYVAPSGGSDSNAGTNIAAPWATWQKAFNTAQAGDIVYFRGGVWYPQDYTVGNAITIIAAKEIEGAYTGPTFGNDGTYANPICFFNYPGETPILDCSQVDTVGHPYNTGIEIYTTDYLHFKGLTVRNVYQTKNAGRVADPACGIGAFVCTYLTFENMNVYNIGGRGFSVNNVVGQFGITSDSTRFINCDIHNCNDYLSPVPGNAADGVKIGGDVGGYYEFTGCRVWDCTDDGLDINGNALTIYDHCWSFSNGYPGAMDGNGFKFGAVSENLAYPSRIIRYCLAAYNTGSGFFDLEYEDYYRNNSRVYNNTSYKNSIGFKMSDNTLFPASLSHYNNNISYAPTSNDAGGRPAYWFSMCSYIESHNTWDWAVYGSLPQWIPTDTVTVTDADFISIDSTGLTSPRHADGSLPDINFLRLKSTSDLVDAGTPYIHDVAYIPFYGSAPDIGYNEFDEPIVADHTIVDRFDDIPAYYITEIKKMLIWVPGESHEAGYATGITELYNLYSTYYGDASWSFPGYTEEGLRFSRYPMATLGEREWFTWKAYTTSPPAEDSYVTDILSQQVGLSNPIRMAMFAWCWDMVHDNGPTATADPTLGVHWYGSTINGPDGSLAWGLNSVDYAQTGNRVSMDTYLAATEDYITYAATNSPTTSIVFSTGPVDSYIGEQGYQVYLKHEYIRDYVEANGKMLFDYADILCYDDNGDQTTTSWGGHTYPIITTTNLGSADVGHIGSAGRIRLAKAMWWLLARIAGWDGVSTSPTTVTDIDGNNYNLVTVGTQTWIATNLATTKYNNGSSIPNVTSNSSWAVLTTPAYSWYSNNVANKATYGALYNWYAVNAGNLCPTGWHVSTDAEFKALEVYRGMTSGQSDATQWRGTTEGTELKDENFWLGGGAGTNNSPSVSVRPSGFRFSQDGGFYNLGYIGYFWTATQLNAANAYVRRFDYDKPTVYRDGNLKTGGKSVRCIKD